MSCESIWLPTALMTRSLALISCARRLRNPASIALSSGVSRSAESILSSIASTANEQAKFSASSRGYPWRTARLNPICMMLRQKFGPLAESIVCAGEFFLAQVVDKVDLPDGPRHYKVNMVRSDASDGHGMFPDLYGIYRWCARWKP